MLRIGNLPLPIGGGMDQLRRRAARELGVRPGALGKLEIVRQSIDARNKGEVHYVYTVEVSMPDEAALLKTAPGRNITLSERAPYVFPAVKRRSPLPPVVVGMGPAGLFAALFLAGHGLPCVILERGQDVDRRALDVEKFWGTGILDECSNVQFGEGGAGAFSDGKLTTGTHDKRISAVLEALAAAGAPADIMWSHKPHIGTDVLREVVKTIRQKLIALGCDVRFGHKLVGLATSGGALAGVEVEGPNGIYTLPADALILAPGHSARDTFAMLRNAGVPMEQKKFAIGVRIEHRQREISLQQYGPAWERLPPSDYKLACHLPNGRSAFTFCVCPGGQVVAAASRQAGVVTNGMSHRARGEHQRRAAGGGRPGGLPGGCFGRGAVSGAVGARGLPARRRRILCPRPAGRGFPSAPALGGPRDCPAHLPARSGLDQSVPLPARLCGGYPAPVPAPAGPEAAGVRRPGRRPHRGGNPLFLAGTDPKGRTLSVLPPGAVPLRRGGRVCRGHRLRRRRRHPGG